jgi:DNA-directed RNA polymerase subunit omega
MARVTIEDCRKYIPNRFELVILAAQRAKDLSLGMPPLIQKTKDKDPVLALREIAAGAIDCKKLRDLVLSKHIDPMKKGFKSMKQTAELEEIFKDLASSVVTEVASNNQISDGYEHDDLVDLDSCCNHSGSDEEKYDYEESDDSDEDHHHKQNIKQQVFDVDVVFDDAEVED